jgi:molybdopterin molybdotransferase
MVSVEEAASIILSQPLILQTGNVNLADINGHILAEKITADRDFPPYNRVSMDGIAIRTEELKNQRGHFRLAGTQAAGQPPLSMEDTRDAIEVMTGAVLPAGADAVVRYEDIRINEGVAHLLIDSVKPGQNIHAKGADAKTGDILLEPGIRLTPAEVALLASVGKSSVKVFQFPEAAIISTGNELVDINETPAAWQVRKSNVLALQSALKDFHISSHLFHMNDDEKEVVKKLKEILTAHEIIILSGGVSKGKFDFIPKALEEAGIKKEFHQISQKPGKPFWFGRGDRKFVFALPGNPVSTFLCYYRYIHPWLEISAGKKSAQQTAMLATDFTFSGDLTYFLQVKVTSEAGKNLAHPDAGGGSGDFVNLKEVDGFLELPAHKKTFKAGEVYHYYPFRK